MTKISAHGIPKSTELAYSATPPPRKQSPITASNEVGSSGRTSHTGSWSKFRGDSAGTNEDEYDVAAQEKGDTACAWQVLGFA